MSVDAVSDCQELKTVGRVSSSSSEQDELDRRMSPEAGTECASNSSVVTSVSSEGGSPEGVGSVSVAGYVEDSTMDVVEVMTNDRFKDITYRAVENNEVLQDALRTQLEVLAFDSFPNFILISFIFLLT
jgi:hypothetical protein